MRNHRALQNFRLHEAMLRLPEKSNKWIKLAEIAVPWLNEAEN